MFAPAVILQPFVEKVTSINLSTTFLLLFHAKSFSNLFPQKLKALLKTHLSFFN